MFNEYDDLLTVEELCDILGIGKNAVTCVTAFIFLYLM